MKWIILLLNIIISVLSFVFIKVSEITRQDVTSGLHIPMFSSHKIFYWLAFISYSSTFFCYAVIVKQFPVQISQAIVTCSIIVIITLLSSIFWQEPFYWKTGIGIALITAGMTLITLN